MFGAIGYNQQDIVKDGLVLWLDANDKTSYPGAGTTWRDLSGNNNHFTLYNEVGYSSNNGGYLTFDGTNDYCRSTNTINLTVYSGLVIEVTLLKNNTNTGMVYEFSNNWNSNTGGFGLASDDNGFGTTPGSHHTNWNGGTGPKNYNFSPTTNWHTDTNILMRLNDPTGRLSYVNADLKPYTSDFNTSTTTDSSMVFKNDYFYLGSRGGASIFLNGNIASFRVYSIKLSQNEITQNYNATKARFGL